MGANSSPDHHQFMPFFITLFLAIALCLQRHAAAVAVKAVQPPQVQSFNYSDPRHWGKESPKFKECAVGKNQSPIDIIDKETHLNKSLAPLTRAYHIHNASLINTGVTLEVQIIEGQSWIKIDGRAYRLKQFHWHTPSDHRLNGALYPAELHIVHQSLVDNSTAVVSVLFQYGEPDALVAQIQKHVTKLAEKKCGEHEGFQISITNFNARPLQHKAHKYYRYVGSLTTPPCTEKVTWTVYSKVHSISKEQVASLRAPLCTVNRVNSRPEQPMDGRVVQTFEGSH